jgi:hypothetical protein
MKKEKILFLFIPFLLGACQGVSGSESTAISAPAGFESVQATFAYPSSAPASLQYMDGQWVLYPTSASPDKALTLCQEALGLSTFYRAPDLSGVHSPAFDIHWADSARLSCTFGGDQKQTSILIQSSFVTFSASGDKKNLWGFFSSPALYAKILAYATECEAGRLTSSAS